LKSRDLIIKTARRLDKFNLDELIVVSELDEKEVTEILSDLVKQQVILKNNNTYFSIIDYKTGSIDTHIEAMKYGLHMQLPIYLYLINKTNIFNNPVFTGIYYQNILFNYLLHFRLLIWLFFNCSW